MTGKFKRKASRYGSQKEEEYWKPTVLCDGECPPQCSSTSSNKITHRSRGKKKVVIYSNYLIARTIRQSMSGP